MKNLKAVKVKGTCGLIINGQVVGVIGNGLNRNADVLNELIYIVANLENKIAKIEKIVKQYEK